ncbi:WXG100 family type VII secretion target, partial [Streptomyces mirabilis]|uniref:WXG100 family type VII secretion target n=1 Tax=Streptomyces mirabilis TaxID=68239 RepID=UPI0037F529CD
MGNDYDIPTNSDYNTWGFRQILHVFFGQGEAYNPSDSTGFMPPDSQTLHRAGTAIGDSGSSLRQTQNELIDFANQVNKGDWWVGPTASTVSNVLVNASSVLGDHADALDTHSQYLSQNAHVLDAAQTAISDLWDLATKTVADWWNGLNQRQKTTWVVWQGHYPPVETKGDVTYYRVGDFPEIAGPVEDGMRRVLQGLANSYRLGIANMPSPGQANFPGAGVGSSTPPMIDPPKIEMPKFDAPNVNIPQFDPSQSGGAAGPGGSVPGMPGLDAAGLPQSGGAAGPGGSVPGMPGLDAAGLPQSGGAAG